MPGNRALARNADGTFVVVWSRNVYGSVGIFGQRYDGGGDELGAAFRVSPATLGAGYHAAITSRADGSFVVVWDAALMPPSGSFSEIFGRRFDATGSAIGTAFTANTFTTGNQELPDVADLGAGGFVVVWSGGAYPPVPGIDDSGVFGQRFDPNAAKSGTEFAANSYTTAGQARAKVDSASDGSFVVVWESGGFGYPGPDGSYQAIAAQRFNSQGGKAGTEFVVNTFTPYPETDPDLAVRSDGSFVVVWRTFAGDEDPIDQSISDSITMRRYDATGQPFEDEVHLNSYAMGQQTLPAIAMNDDGSFVVVWQSGPSYQSYDNRDGDGSGNFVVVWGVYGPSSLDYSMGVAGRLVTSGANATTTTMPAAMCGDADTNGTIAATDALIALQTAVGSNSCPGCLCNTNGTGGITATDALVILNSAVGQPVTLACPPC